jgi:hypothetical protein
MYGAALLNAAGELGVPESNLGLYEYSALREIWRRGMGCERADEQASHHIWPEPGKTRYAQTYLA